MKYKMSYYTIISDPVEEDGTVVLYSTKTGGILSATQATLDYIELGLIEEIPADIVEKLIKHGILIHEGLNELEDIIDENEAAISKREERVLYEIIQPSAMCQLGCFYCGQNHTKNNITAEMAKKIANRIKLKLEEGDYIKLSIAWFGAEPLMGLQQIRLLTEMFQQLADEFNIEFEASMVSNGLSLKPQIFKELSTKLCVKSIEVTLDGTADGHDQNRYIKSGEPSFNLILNNLRKILLDPEYNNLGCSISIRCNVSAKTSEYVLPLIQLLAKEGLHEKISKFYMIGIYAWGNDAHLSALTKQEFAIKEVQWLIEMIKLKYPAVLFPKRKKVVCMAVSPDSEVYDAFGNIFNCTEIPYVNNYDKSPFLIGNIQNSHAEHEVAGHLSDWNETILTDRFPCHSCKMLPVCGGGCPKSWHEDMSACPSFKFNVKDKLKLAYLLSKSNSIEEFSQKATASFEAL